jgi:hypothetical protein
MRNKSDGANANDESAALNHDRFFVLSKHPPHRV